MALRLIGPLPSSRETVKPSEKDKSPDGEFTFRKRGPSWNIGFYVGGVRHWHTARTKQAAREYALEQIRLYEQDIDEAGVAMTVAELADRFIAHCYERAVLPKDGERPDLSPTTLACYRNMAGWAKQGFGKILIRKLRAPQIEAFVRLVRTKGIDYPDTLGKPHPHRKLNDKSCVNLINFISGMLRYTKRERLIEGQVETELVARPRVQKKKHRIWTPEQSAAFLRAIVGERLEALFWLLLTSGLRKGELIALKWIDIDFEAGEIMVRRQHLRLARHEREFLGGRDGIYVGLPKSDAGIRKLPLIPEAATKMLEWRARQHLERRAAGDRWLETGAVFTSWKGNVTGGHRVGRHLDPRWVNRYVDAITDKHGSPRLKVHEFRHTAITALLHNTREIIKVKEFAGHSSIRVTADVYGEEIKDGHREMGELMRAILGHARMAGGASGDSGDGWAG